MYISKYYNVEEIDERLKQGYFNDAVSEGFKGTLKEFWTLVLSISKKVDSKEGYGLSQEDFTTELKEKLNSLSKDIPQKISELENDLEYQTKEQVESYISNLIDGADGALDTLKELAEALNNDPNFASTITNKLIEVRDALLAEVTRAKEAEAELKSQFGEVDGKIEKAATLLYNQINSTIENIHESILRLDERISKNTSDIANVRVEVAGNLADFKIEVSALVEAEKDRAKEAERDLKDKIDEVKNTSVLDKAGLETKIQEEVTARQHSDEELRESINQEVESRERADEELRESINRDLEKLGEDKVGWRKFPTSELPNRKAIVLNNGDMILGGNPDNSDTLPLIQYNRFGVIDAGSPKAPFNINTPKGKRPTIQEAGQSGEQAHQVAYFEDLEEINREVDKKIAKEVSDREAADELLVKKEEGKGLSSNDFTNDLKEKLDNIEAFANYITKVSELANDANYQTYDQVNSLIESIIGSAPEVLNTLEEIAQALGEDPNFAATITKKLAALAEQLNDEIENREKGDTAIQENLNIKYSELSNLIQSQSEKLNEEISERKDSESVIISNLTKVASDLNSLGMELRQTIAQVNSSLEQSIRAQDELIRANTQGIQQNLNLIQNIQEKNTGFESSITKLTSDLAKEISDREVADETLDERILSNIQSIAKEVSDREAADIILKNGLDKEILDRTQADTELRQDLTKKITDEITERTEKDEELEDKWNSLPNTLIKEVQVYQNFPANVLIRYFHSTKDSTGKYGIPAEVNKVILAATTDTAGVMSAADKQALEKVIQDLVSEIDRAYLKEGELEGNLNTEIANRTDSEEALRSSIQTLSSDLNTFKGTKDQPEGLASLDENGKVKSSQLPEAVYNVVGIELEVPQLSDMDSVPNMNIGDKLYVLEDKKIYTKIESGWDDGITPLQNVIYNFRREDSEGRSNITKRWDGENLTVISDTVSLGEVDGTAYEGSKGSLNRNIIKSIPTQVLSSYTSPIYEKDNVKINFQYAKRTSNIETFGGIQSNTISLNAATPDKAGVMSAADKVKLDSLSEGSGGGVIRPENPVPGQTYFDTSFNKLGIWNGTMWVDSMGNPLEAKVQGTTEERPTNVKVGYIFYNTEEEIFEAWNGTLWVPITYLVTSVNQINFDPDGGSSTFKVASNTKWSIQ